MRILIKASFPINPTALNKELEKINRCAGNIPRADEKRKRNGYKKTDGEAEGKACNGRGLLD